LNLELLKPSRQFGGLMACGRSKTLGVATWLLPLAGLTWLCQEIWEKESFRFDTTVLLGIHRWANPLLDQLMLGITRLGNPEVVVMVVAVSGVWLVRRQQFRSAVLLLFTCLGTLMLNQGMKLIFARPRPLLWPRLIPEVSYGFPSGHALGAMVLYGLLACLLARRYAHYSRPIYLIAAILISAIGLSRLYLGVHYPTDILAGYTVGFLWLITCRFIFRMKSPQSRQSGSAG
jgi:membrane-associated phospholipid phosphatase